MSSNRILNLGAYCYVVIQFAWALQRAVCVQSIKIVTPFLPYTSLAPMHMGGGVGIYVWLEVTMTTARWLRNKFRICAVIENLESHEIWIADFQAWKSDVNLLKCQNVKSPGQRKCTLYILAQLQM